MDEESSEEEESEEESVLDDEESSDEEMVEAEDTSMSIEHASIKDLNDMLNNALAQENYELAASIRDEIEKRKKS